MNRSTSRPGSDNVFIKEAFLGGASIVGITIITILLWLLFRPASQPTSRYVGEILGTTAILLFSCSLIVATKAPFIEASIIGVGKHAATRSIQSRPSLR